MDAAADRISRAKQSLLLPDDDLAPVAEGGVRPTDFAAVYEAYQHLLSVPAAL
ncbi:MAG: hypothetical protein R2861_13945 [Desulfobacterales bacterium]